MKTTIYLPIATMLLTAALAVPVAAENLVPFKGSIQGHEIDTPQGGPPPTTLSVNGSATGIASHVGQFSFTYQLTVTLANGTATGFARLIAANGDSIYTTVVGQAELSDIPGGFLKVTEIHTITSGTGRFTGAQGSFTVELFHELEASGVAGGVETHDIFGSFHGTVISTAKDTAKREH